MDEDLRKEFIKKYQWAGKIRFISFLLLFCFLLLMKVTGGYSYLNFALVGLIIVEAILNQPYSFFLKRVNIYRFQFYQMLTDIIAISWIIYYMGGIEAPVVSIAYYAVILWAGVVSGTQAVFFAVIASCFFLSVIVLLEHFGMLPRTSYLNYQIATSQMSSLLLGNISFMFAFGYFSSRSSKVIKSLERKRQEQALRYTHKLTATGYLVGGTAHDLLNYLSMIKGYIQILNIKKPNSEEKTMLNSIEEVEQRGSDLLTRLARFSRKPEQKFEPTDISTVIEDALKLTWPVVKYSKMSVKKLFESDIPLIMADREQLQEVFVTLILNSKDATLEEGILIIQTSFIKKDGVIEIAFSDTGIGIKQEDLKRIGEAFFTTKEPKEAAGLSLAVAYGIIARHNGKIEVKSTKGKGTTFTIQLPVKKIE